MDAEKTLTERVAQACSSSDLSHKPTTCDVDFIHALGVLGVRSKGVDAVLRYDMTLAETDFQRALRSASNMIAEIAARRGWPMDAKKRQAIAKEVMMHHAFPSCGYCHGRGVTGVEHDGSPYRPKPCSSCDGTGRRQLPKKMAREVKEVLHELQSRHGTAERTLRSLMSSS